MLSLAPSNTKYVQKFYDEQGIDSNIHSNFMDVGLFMEREKRISIKLQSQFNLYKMKGNLRNKIKVKELVANLQ